ncbi:MAG: hypothetical protein U5K54_25470 [Cytophagales bacterium]|nr:hypothetical protein [Cytophagales bacterium]
MQFAGTAIARNNFREFTTAPTFRWTNIRAFSETMFLLLGGTGVRHTPCKTIMSHKLPPTL